MRRRTHNLFSFAISFAAYSSLLKLELFYSAIISLYLSTVVNYVIDTLGGHKGFRRAPYMHSILGSTAISIIASIPVIAIATHIIASVELWIELVAIAIVVGLSHIFLDMFTADGIYALWPFTKTRVSLLKARYDNPILNMFTVLISITIIIATLYSKAGVYIEMVKP
ncbi:MAG: metal-dependent hydrolase [Desulfurococcaceae archaeon]|nr:metal-dependent hydrolase [Desulfurococcaceae archaeon]